MTSTVFGTLPALPRISVRLTASQLLLAKPGFIRMVVCIRRIRQGESPNPYVPADDFMPKVKFSVIPGVEIDVLSCPFQSIRKTSRTMRLEEDATGNLQRTLCSSISRSGRCSMDGIGRGYILTSWISAYASWRYVLSRSKFHIITSSLPVPTISDMQSNS